jgi:hypothetical protein
MIFWSDTTIKNIRNFDSFSFVVMQLHTIHLVVELLSTLFPPTSYPIYLYM